MGEFGKKSCYLIYTGYLKDVDTMLRLKGMGLTEREKIVTVSFDELYVKKDIAYDQNTDQFVGPHNRANVMLLRGLTKNYKVCHKIMCYISPFKVENIYKRSLDLIPSPSPSVKIQIIGGKVYLR